MKPSAPGRSSTNRTAARRPSWKTSRGAVRFAEDAPMPPARPNTARLLILGGGCVLLALLFAQLGPSCILSMLSTLGPNFLTITALFACHECVRAYAVCRFFPIDRRPSWRRVLRIRLLGEAVGPLTRTGAFGAEPTRPWMHADPAGRWRLRQRRAARETPDAGR